MQVHVAAAAVVGGEMKHQVHAAHSLPSHTIIEKIGMYQLDGVGLQV
jgi:hypothetical protein